MKRLLIPTLMLVALNAAAAGRGRVIRTPHGQPTAWTAPNCTTTYGLPGFYFTRDEGRTVSVNAQPRPVNTPLHVVATDIPNRMFAILGQKLYDSSDAGCNWSVRSTLPTSFLILVAAPGGRAYAWGYGEQRLLRVSTSSFDSVELPDLPIAFGVDPDDAQHLIAVTRMRVHESYDAGSSWSGRQIIPYPLIDAAAVDPSDVRHIAVSFVGLEGAVPRIQFSRDGGMTWQVTSTKGVKARNLAFSPADPNVVWIQGNVYPYGVLNVYRSIDGGVAFDNCVTSSSILFTNSTLAPSPKDSHLAAYGASAGLAIIDAVSGAIRLAPPGGWDSVSWSPAPGVIYLTSVSIFLHDP